MLDIVYRVGSQAPSMELQTPAPLSPGTQPIRRATSSLISPPSPVGSERYRSKGSSEFPVTLVSPSYPQLLSFPPIPTNFLCAHSQWAITRDCILYLVLNGGRYICLAVISLSGT